MKKDRLIKEITELQYSQHQLLNTLQTIRNKTYELVDPAIMYSQKKSPKNSAILKENFKLLMGISFSEYVEILTIILKNKNVDGHFQNNLTHL